MFIFTSDNGSEASNTGNPRSLGNRLALHLQGYNNDYDTLGLKGRFNSIGASFASAAAAPLAYYKFYAGEGGMRVPLIIAGPAIPQNQQHSNAFTYVTDIAPTVLQLTGVKPPGQRFAGRPVEPMTGRSLMPLIQGEVEWIYSDSDYIGYELAGNAALFQGNYKIVINRGPVGDSRWHLFNIVSDPGETQDLSEQMPERFAQMLGHYQTYVEINGVLPMPEGYKATRQGVINGLHDLFGQNTLLELFTLITLLPFYIGYRLVKRSR